MRELEIRHAVEVVFSTLMEERGTPLSAIDAGLGLYDGGYGLDSMDTATLSAMLSERFENDPYTSGIFPKNIGEIVAFYTGRAHAG
jgi:acyl carrier protein